MHSLTSRTLALWVAALASAWPRGAAYASTPYGAWLERVLRNRNAIDDTLRAQVRSVLEVLVTSSAAWPCAQVNGEYDSRALNLYLIDLRAAANGPPIGELSGLQGTLLGLPESRLILADAGYVAQLKAAADVYSDSLERSDASVRPEDLLARAMAEGPDALVSRAGLAPGSWGAGTNETFEGAMAFLIAHEMGHVAAGVQQRHSAMRGPRGLRGVNADRAWACARLVGPDVNARRAEEADADAYAAALIQRVPHSSKRAPRLRYEYGTVFLQLAELGKVVATLAAISPRRDQLAAAARIDPAVIASIREWLGGDGAIESAFPATHPAQVERLMSVVDRIAASPSSAFHSGADIGRSRMLWRLVGLRIEEMCSAISAKPNGR